MKAIGPDQIVEILKENIEKLPAERAVFELEKYRERLDQYQRHIFLSVVSSEENFSLFSMIDTEGRYALGLSIVDPFEKNLMIYSSTLDCDLLEKLYKNLFGVEPDSVKSGIIRLPFQSKVLTIVGVEELLHREILKEKVYGTENLSFAARIDQETFERLRVLNGKRIDFCTVHLLNDHIVCVLTMPEEFNPDHAPLLAEISRIYRKRYGVPYQGNVGKLKRFSSILTAFLISYESFLNGHDVEQSCTELCTKVRKAYKCIIDLEGSS
ncbi:MAG: DUF4895 domain-containing protein [Pseudothermotoga sp.]